MMYYKVLNADGTCVHGGQGSWPLDGTWLPRIDAPVPCERGYHLCRRQDLIEWFGPAIWETEIAKDSVIVETEDKVVTSGPVRLTRRLPWDDRSARLYAADCAERVVHLCGDDPRPRAAIAAARAYARGEITSEQLAAAEASARAAARAAWASAWAAARDAAWDAARDAARTPAWWAAAWASASAAEALARAPAWAAERHWQTDRLWEYLEGK